MDNIGKKLCKKLTKSMFHFFIYYIIFVIFLFSYKIILSFCHTIVNHIKSTTAVGGNFN